MPVRKEKQLRIPETVLLRKRAQLDYEVKLSDSRTGVALNKEEFYRMDEIVSAAIQKGQHLNHIIASNEMSASRASIYRYLEKAICPQSPLISPCREIQKAENQKPTTHS